MLYLVKKGEKNMKKVLLSLLVLISLLFTFVSCEAEAEISTPQKLNDTDTRTLDLLLDDLFTETEKLSSTQTPLISDLSSLLNDALLSIQYSDATSTNNGQTISFDVTITEEKNTEKIDVLITMKNLSTPVADDNGAKHIITGTIKGSYKDDSLLDSASFVDSASFTITYTKDGVEQAPISVNITEENIDSYFTINDKQYTLTTYYNTILNNNCFISNSYEDALVNKIKNEGISFESDIAKVYFKGEWELSSPIYLYLNPVTIELKRPILINNKEYSGKIEVKALLLGGGSDVLLDISLSFDLERKDGEAKNKYSGVIDFNLNTFGHTSSSSTDIPLLTTVKSLSINNKPIVTKDVYDHIVEFITTRE